MNNSKENIRAALIHDEYTAEMSRRHNCANFFAIPGKYVDNDILEIDSSQLPDRGKLKRKLQFKCKIKNTMVGFNPAYTGLVVEKSPKILREV